MTGWHIALRYRKQNSQGELPKLASRNSSGPGYRRRLDTRLKAVGVSDSFKRKSNFIASNILPTIVPMSVRRRSRDFAAPAELASAASIASIRASESPDSDGLGRELHSAIHQDGGRLLA